MTTLVEQPLPILFVGVLLSAMLAAALVQTGRRVFLYALSGVLVLTGVLLAVERLVVTDAEHVEATLHTIARDLEQNDSAAVLRHISEMAPEIRSEAERTLKWVQISEAKIKRNLSVQVHPNRNPPLAEASFNGVIVGGDVKGSIKNQRYARFFVVTFRREQDAWRVIRYEDKDPREGI